MTKASEDKDMDETKRIMERLVKTPPDPKGGKGKGDSQSRRLPVSKEDRENCRDAE